MFFEGVGRGNKLESLFINCSDGTKLQTEIDTSQSKVALQCRYNKFFASSQSRL